MFHLGYKLAITAHELGGERARSGISTRESPGAGQLNINKTSVTKKVDVKLLNKLAKFDGSHKPTLREWLDSILEVLLHIPGGARALLQ